MNIGSGCNEKVLTKIQKFVHRRCPTSSLHEHDVSLIGSYTCPSKADIPRALDDMKRDLSTQALIHLDGKCGEIP
jgi:hypothetical protein